MSSGAAGYFETIANLGFLALFPGFVVYHFVVSVGMMPPILGGLFGAACAGIAVFAIAQLAVMLHSQRGELSLLQWFFVLFCGFFLLWVLVAGALNPHRFSSKAAVMECVGTLIIWLAVFFVGSRMTMQSALMRVALPLAALAVLALFVYAIAREGSFLGPFLLFAENDPAEAVEGGSPMYQGVGRSILIVALVLAACHRRFWKQAIVLTVAVASLLCLGSRAHLFGAVLIIAALTAIMGIKRGQRVAAFAFVAGALLIAYVSVELFLETRASEILDLATSSSWQVRVELQHRALQVISENPMTGDFGYHYWGTFAGYAHNALSAWAGLGVVIFLGYIGLMGYALSLSLKRVLTREPDPLWLIAFQANFVALILAAASEPIFASVFPAFGWGVTVNALRQERRRSLAARKGLELAAACAERRIEWPPGRYSGTSI